MRMTDRERTRLNILILFVSAMSWLMLLLNPGSLMSIAHCPVTESGVSPASFRMMLEMNPVSSFMAGWILMLVAMMSPTLIAPIRHVRERSFKRRRARSVTLFVISYAAVWTAAGVVLLAMTLMLNLLFGQSLVPAILVGMTALIWQCSPIKQRCLNRGHNHSALAAFGSAADREALRFGMTHGIWCVGSCWALMFFPMLLSHGHFVAMAVVTYIMTSERLEHSKPLGWRWRFSGKLWRIAVSQTRMRLPN